MKRILVIDDERTFKFEATYVKTVKEAEKLLDEQEWDEVWLDHDLGDTFKTDAYEVAVYAELKAGLEFKPLRVGTFVIHSGNPVGRMKMYDALYRWYDVKMVRAEDYM